MNKLSHTRHFQPEHIYIEIEKRNAAAFLKILLGVVSLSKYTFYYFWIFGEYLVFDNLRQKIKMSIVSSIDLGYRLIQNDAHVDCSVIHYNNCGIGRRLIVSASTEQRATSPTALYVYVGL